MSDAVNGEGLPASRLHWSTRVSAIAGAVVALLVLGPIAAAVVMLRCCSDASGPGAGAYVVLAVIVLAAMALSAAITGGLAAMVRRLARIRRA